MSLDIWDHTVLPATRHKWTHTALTPAMQAGTRFTYPGRMEGWVDLVDLIAPRPGVEPVTFRSRVQRSINATTETTFHISNTFSCEQVSARDTSLLLLCRLIMTEFMLYTYITYCLFTFHADFYSPGSCTAFSSLAFYVLCFVFLYIHHLLPNIINECVCHIFLSLIFSRPIAPPCSRRVTSRNRART